MSIVQNNPFNKANPFKLGQFDRFHHAHLPTNKPTNYTHLIYHDSSRLQNSHAINNNWVFHNNNLTKRVDFKRKNDLNKSEISEFQIHMRVSSVYNPKNQTKIIEHKQTKLQNPFNRKNFIIDKNAVANQIEADLSIYRNRSSTTYQPPLRYSFGIPNLIDQSPTIKSKYSNQQQRYSEKERYVIETRDGEIQLESPNPLTYSKTPQMTQRESNRQKQFIPPKTIEFKRKTFFLNNATLN